MYTQCMNTKPQRYRDWYSSLLLILLVYTSAARLTATSWLKDLNYVESLAVFGTLLGLALGISRFEKRIIAWLVFLYSIVVIPLHFSNMIEGETDLGIRLLSLAGRTGAVLQKLFSGSAVEDPLFFILFMGLLFWFLGIFVSYQTIRHASFGWIAVLPTIPLLIVQYYDGGSSQRLWILAFYFLILLILLGRTTLKRNREKWANERIFAGTEPDFDLNYSIVVGACIIILVAWLFPSPASALPAAARWWQQATQPFEQTRKDIDEILASLRRGAAGTERYGAVMGLGQNAATGSDVAFSVRPPKGLLPRQYWRARIYDIYFDGAWRASSTTALPFSPDAELPPIVMLKDKPTAEFEFAWQGGPQSLLMLPGNTLWVSRSGNIQYASIGLDQIDPLNQRALPLLQTGDRYTARAYIQNPTILELRKAGTDYPDWVKDRYLRLPEDISPQIVQLARELAANQPNPYDKAQAITDYLRNNINYSETVPAPPPGVDPLNWFLFTWKSGFCNYYATAEVLLLRAAGVPARMAVGYAQGEYDNGAYLVRGRDAHAWPEVFFPEIGWVEFEPTTNQSPIFRPNGDETSAPADRNLPTNDEEDKRDLRGLGQADEQINGTPATTSSPFAIIASLILNRNALWVIISLLFAGVITWSWRTRRIQPLVRRIPHAIQGLYIRNKWTVPEWVNRWVLWNDRTSIERSFHAINQCLSWLRQSQSPSVTSIERAELLKKLVPEISQDVDILSSELEHTLFSQQPGNPARAMQASWRIRYYTLRRMIRLYLYGA